MKQIDLHGTLHSDAELKIENFVLMYQNECPIRIITGNSAVFQNITRKLLDKYGFIYEYESDFNLGSIIVLGFYK